MTETIDREKTNFLLWYEMATDEDKEKAKSTNCKKYEELLTKYKTEIQKIDLHKGFLNMQRATYGLPLRYSRIASLS